MNFLKNDGGGYYSLLKPKFQTDAKELYKILGESLFSKLYGIDYNKNDYQRKRNKKNK